MLKITSNYAKNIVCIINLSSYMIRKGHLGIHITARSLTLSHLSKSVIILLFDYDVSVR